MRLWSDDFVDGGKLGLANALNGWGHEGENRSPHLAWDDVPEGTKSFALTLFDFTPGLEIGWWHWVAFNIPAGTRSIAAGAKLPPGTVEARSDLGTFGYSGPGPGPGNTNSYRFTLYALSVEHLELDENASGTMVSYMAGTNMLAKAEIVGLFE